MTKFRQSKKTPAASAKQSKTRPRTASTKSSNTTAAGGTVPADPRRRDAPPTGKIAAIAAHLRRPKGASIADLMKVTGWQAHSVRGAISASIKKRLGLKVASEKTGAVRLYRIADKPAG